MKTFFLASFAFLLFAFAAPLAAADGNEPLIVRSQMSESGLELIVANLEQAFTTVTMENLDTKESVFFDRIKNHNGYSYNFQLDALPKGRYLLKVTKDKTIRQQVIVIGKNGVMCSDWK